MTHVREREVFWPDRAFALLGQDGRKGVDQMGQWEGLFD